MSIKICLDAGHYGKYNRSPAIPAYYESEMNWKLHLLLKAQLEQYGFEVSCTRSDLANDLELVSRGRASSGCDLFMSIHSNAVGDGMNESVDYPVVYAQLDGKGDKLGNALATTIEKVMETKQDGRVNHRKGNNGEYYGVLRGAAAVGTMGLILEHSFHTNTRSTNWLLDESNLAKLAAAEAEVIADYFGVEKQPDNVWYCVQVGAYSDPKNAAAQLEKVKAAGFTDAFVTTKPKAPAEPAAPAEPVKPAAKSVDELAREVIAGKWSSGTERKQMLTAAGYDYAAIQKRVNELMKG